MSRVPISNTNIPTLIGIESAFGTIATHGFRLAYDSNTLTPVQALAKNVELRGNRQMGSRVPDVKNPGGALAFHMTDKNGPFGLYAALGAMDAGTISPQAAPTAVLIATAGLVTSGAHSYRYVVTDVDGNDRGSAISAPVTTDTATHGQVAVGKAGVLPSGWTWAVYRTAAAADPAVDANYKLIPAASALGAAVVTFTDDVADASLSSTYPGSFTADDNTHVITIGDELSSYTIERGHLYVGGTPEYYPSLGCVVNKSSISVKATGWFDIALDMLFSDISGPNATSFDVAPTDWRGGEKIHHAMALAANTKLDGTAFAKFLDLKIDHMNNLNTEDVPIGGGGSHASYAAGNAETQVTGTLVVSEDTDLAIVRDTTVKHTLELKWSFATLSHYVKCQLFGVQFDPVFPSPQGQGILKFSANGFASQPDGGQQVIWTFFNGVPTATYKT